MNGQEVLDFGRDALWTTVLMCTPAMIAGLVVGLAIAFFQARVRPLHTLLENKYYLDWINENIVARGARALGFGLWKGGDHGPNTQRTSTTNQCHDITVYPEVGLAAGACSGNGILLDISDRANPVVLDRVQDAENFAFWHSATFNNAGTKVVFTDELGGGGGATCNTTIGPKRGANAIYDVETKKVDHPGKGKGKGAHHGKGKEKSYELVFASYYKIPRVNANTENCVAHNGSLIPVKGKDIMVQAWYQGGISVWDFTDSANPVEFAYWDRGPLSDERLILGGSWSAYYYNGYIYSSDIQKGLDVLKLTDKRTKSAERVKFKELNVQSQGAYQSW